MVAPRGPSVNRQKHRLEVVGPHLLGQLEALHGPALCVFTGSRQRTEPCFKCGSPIKETNAVVMQKVSLQKAYRPPSR